MCQNDGLFTAGNAKYANAREGFTVASPDSHFQLIVITLINNTFALLHLKVHTVTRKSPQLYSLRVPGNDGLFKDIKKRSSSLSYARI